jgi:hypothetical protein
MGDAPKISSPFLRAYYFHRFGGKQAVPFIGCKRGSKIDPFLQPTKSGKRERNTIQMYGRHARVI